jgi:formylglycine-generating enzyme required for sulfatase activity
MAPAVELNWLEAYAFAAYFGGRLPTEAEWEYAARAGANTRYTSGTLEADAGNGWYFANSDGKLHRVGQLPSNPWGLFDIGGNAAEWCADWMGTYPTRKQLDPVGPPGGETRVIRGGSYLSGVSSMRVFKPRLARSGQDDQQLGLSRGATCPMTFDRDLDINGRC